MNVSVERDDGVSTSELTLSEEHHSKTNIESPVKPEGTDSPASSCVCIKCDGSMSEPVTFEDGDISDKQNPVKPETPDSPAPRGLSMRSDRSMFEPILFNDGDTSHEQIPVKPETPDSPAPRGLSMRSDSSMFKPILFNDGDTSDWQIPVKPETPDSPAPRGLSMRSDRSMFEPILFNDGDTSHEQIYKGHRKRSEVLSNRPVQKHQTSLDSIFQRLEENIVTFVKNELEVFKKVLGPKYPECLEKLREEDEVLDDQEEEQRRSSRDAFLNITLTFLRKIKQDQLADSLKSKTLVAICQNQLKSNLKDKFQCLFEGLAKAGNPTLLNRIYTDLHITQGESGIDSNQHEVRQAEAASRKPASSETTIRCEDVFKPLPGREEPVRTLVTKGVAGIGKTVLTRKYILDWAEGKANNNIHFVFPFTFRELNLLKEKKYSLVELLHHSFRETQKAAICKFEQFKVVFIIDGLDESQLHLDFHNNEILTDATQSTSVEVLLTNLIRGKLLPTARLWITTRPAAAHQIPPQFVDMVTEVKGFSDPQKEEYFRKKFRDEEQASRIISHMETSRSLHVMCHIPVFCWVSAAVLEHVVKNQNRGELPKTLTEMYIHFLLVLTKQGNVKYHSSTATDPVWNTETKKTILSLGRLAFEQLEKGNLIFCEADLKNCGIDIKAASVHSGLFTEVLKDEHGLNQEKVFCFVHQSIQEFLAALYVFLTFVNTDVDLLRRNMLPSQQPSTMPHKSIFKHLYQEAVDKSLRSPNGHLDLFVRFLLGLSLETNQTLLRGLLIKTARQPRVKEMLVQYIKTKIRDNLSPERSINLFHCLNELNDHSLEEEIQQYLRSGSSFENKLSPSQWSALTFILLSSQKDLDKFDLRKFSASEEGLLWLMPVVKASKTSLLSDCALSWRSCEALSLAFAAKNSSLTELDLSNNDLGDTGAMLLSAGLKNPLCRLEILRLSGCLITEAGCTLLAPALKSNPAHLRELDLSFNHLEGSGLKLLCDGRDDPHWKLEILKIDHCGKCRLKPKPLRYFCELSLDPNTADRNLSLFADNKGVMSVNEKQPYPDHLERIDSQKQLLCSEGLTGRCYWEVQWAGTVDIGVTYTGIKRKEDSCLGRNDQSWSLSCSAQVYTAWHNNTSEVKPTPSESNRVAVYLDWPAGSVSFYCLPSKVFPPKRIHLHTFHSRFTEPLYPAFGFGQMQQSDSDSQLLPSSIYLSQTDD